MVRASVRRVCGVFIAVVGASVVALALSACTASNVPNSGDPQGSTPPAAHPSTSPVVTPEPSAETPTSTWSPPADPAEEGPTVAPPLPEVEGDLDEPITLSTGVVVSVDSITTMTVTPQTPGEYAGPAVIVTVSVSNDSEESVDVSSAVVNLVADDGEVGIATTAGPNRPLQGTVAAGARVTGTYVFMLDPAERRTVTVSVNYAAGEPVARFAGSTT